MSTLAYFPLPDAILGIRVLRMYFHLFYENTKSRLHLVSSPLKKKEEAHFQTNYARPNLLLSSGRAFLFPLYAHTAACFEERHFPN